MFKLSLEYAYIGKILKAAKVGMAITDKTLPSLLSSLTVSIKQQIAKKK
jgi:hypothetical protein